MLAEVVWVSKNRYDASRADITGIVRRLPGIRQLTVQDSDVAWQALRQFESTRADSTDCLIQRSAEAAGSHRTVSFDKRAGKTFLI